MCVSAERTMAEKILGALSELLPYLILFYLFGYAIINEGMRFRKTA